MLAWHVAAHGRDCSYCRASEQQSQKCLAFIFSLTCRKYLKNEGHTRGFFNPHPPGCSGVQKVQLDLCWHCFEAEGYNALIAEMLCFVRLLLLEHAGVDNVATALDCFFLLSMF